MGTKTMAEAIAPLRSKFPKVIRKHEILRVAAEFPYGSAASIMAQARNEVLAWASRRTGEELPATAWQGESFESSLAGGRTTIGSRIIDEGLDLWALTADDPDKNVAQRVWTTEVVIGQKGANRPQLGVRLIVSTPEDELDIEPAVPGLVKQIADRCVIQVGGFDANSSAFTVTSEADARALIAMITDEGRMLPVFVASGDERSNNPDVALIDAASLARATVGIAHVAVLPAKHSYSLTDAFGKALSVYHGAVRVYRPSFGLDANPYDHELMLSDRVAANPAFVSRTLKSIAAAESIRRTRLGVDVVPFGSVRSAAIKIEQERMVAAGASDSEQLSAAKRRIESLMSELNQLKEFQELYDLDIKEAESRAKEAESQLYGAKERIRQLEEVVKSRGAKQVVGDTPPDKWIDFVKWFDVNCAGKLSLTSAAKTGIKKAEFDDPSLAARCLLWLAGRCRDTLIGGGGSLANVPIEPGVQNAPCGADAFEFNFRGRRYMADWHVKNGGNTRDRKRCLRIYYAWDLEAQEIIVADMPAHRRTGAS